MVCEQLTALRNIVQSNPTGLILLDVMHVVCDQCSRIEVCPAMLGDEYDFRQSAKTHPENHRNRVNRE